MPNPFVKGWNYLKASFDKSIDDNADPKVLVHQAMQAARQQHAQIEKQAAAVIGSAKRTEESLPVKEKELEKLQGQVRQAVQMADDARAAGDTAKAGQWETTAERLAAQLVSAEQDLEQTRSLAEQGRINAEQAKQAVADSERRLRETLAQEDQLLLQAQQAKMSEQQQTSINAISGEASLGNTPTFEQIRAKIENRYNTALGEAELAEANAGTSQALADARALERETAGRDKLAQIRADMGVGGGTGAAGNTGTAAGSAAAGEVDVTDSAVDEAPTPAPGTGTPDTGTEAPGFPRDTRSN